MPRFGASVKLEPLDRRLEEGLALFQVELRGISKRFIGATADAVRDLDLEVAAGERFVIVGASGSGKSTVLRMIAGLETPTTGEIRIGGARMNEVPPRLRGVAMVFQHQALYPHLTVFENLAFGLRARRVPRAETTDRTHAVADWLGLASFLGRKPQALSGGERQRVAIGRAVVTRPSVLLLDEPFSGLDAPLRASTRDALLDIHRRVGGTLILVTHDQTEAIAIGDRVALMRLGGLEQVGTPRELYDRPMNPYVAGFLGDPPMALLPCRLSGGNVEIEGSTGGLVLIDAATLPGLESAWLGLRPETIGVDPGNEGPRSLVRLRATVDRVEPRGYDSIAHLCLGGHTIHARVDAGFVRSAGESVEIAFDLGRAHWFPRPKRSESLSRSDAPRPDLGTGSNGRGAAGPHSDAERRNEI